MEGCIVVLDASEILSVFGVIINILLIKPDEPYFVCELLEIEDFRLTCTVLLSKEPSQFPLFSASQMNC